MGVLTRMLAATLKNPIAYDDRAKGITEMSTPAFLLFYALPLHGLPPHTPAPLDPPVGWGPPYPCQDPASYWIPVPFLFRYTKGALSERDDIQGQHRRRRRCQRRASLSPPIPAFNSSSALQSTIPRSTNQRQRSSQRMSRPRYAALLTHRLAILSQ